MAIFHLSAKTVSRGKGQSAIAKAAYNARDNLRDQQTGQAKDYAAYARASGVVFSAIFAPKNAPEWTRDREALWNEVERSEKRKDAQLAREVTLGLPHELTDEQRRQLVTDFVREQFQRRGMIADVNIHAPGELSDDRNHHAHVLLTMREVGPEGFGPKVREWNSREQLETWREGWERIQNRYLERHGHEARVDRRTLEAQGIEREPTTHLGPHAHAMEHRKAIDTERGDTNRQSFIAQRETAKLKLELAQVEREIAAAEREAARETRAGATRPELTPTPLERTPPALNFDTAAREATRPTVRQEVTARSEPLAAARIERASDILDRGRAAANDNLRAVGPVLNRGVGLGVRAAAVVFGTVANAFESLIAPPRQRTVREIKEENERQVAAGAPRDAALEKFLYEEEYKYIKEKRQEQAQEQQAQRDYYERQKQNERQR